VDVEQDSRWMNALGSITTLAVFAPSAGLVMTWFA